MIFQLLNLLLKQHKSILWLNTQAKDVRSKLLIVCIYGWFLNYITGETGGSMWCSPFLCRDVFENQNQWLSLQNKELITCLVSKWRMAGYMLCFVPLFSQLHWQGFFWNRSQMRWSLGREYRKRCFFFFITLDQPCGGAPCYKQTLIARGWGHKVKVSYGGGYDLL